MIESQDDYIERLFSAQEHNNPNCPHCGSERTMKVVDPSKRGMPEIPRTYLCAKCGKQFIISPMDDDPNIPF